MTMTMTKMEEEEELAIVEKSLYMDPFSNRYASNLVIAYKAGWAPEVVADGSFTDLVWSY